MKPNVSPIASGPSDDMLCRLLNSHHRTVDAEIIILRNPPISAGIGVIVFFSLFINFSDGVLRFFWPEALDLHPASDTIPEGSADEQADHRDAGRFEDGIGTPPHNNAGIFLGKALHLTIMVVVELDNIMFGRNINLISYVISVVITVLFAIIVNQAMKPKLKAIPMVESLKSVE